MKEKFLTKFRVSLASLPAPFNPHYPPIARAPPYYVCTFCRELILKLHTAFNLAPDTWCRYLNAQRESNIKTQMIISLGVKPESVGCLRFTRARKEFMISRWSAHYMELNCGFPSFVIIISVAKRLWLSVSVCVCLSVCLFCPPLLSLLFALLALALLPECSRQWGKFAVPQNYR